MANKIHGTELRNFSFEPTIAAGVQLPIMLKLIIEELDLINDRLSIIERRIWPDKGES